MISLRGLLSTKESCEAGTIKTIKTFLTWNEDVTISYAPCQQTRREIATGCCPPAVSKYIRECMCQSFLTSSPERLSYGSGTQSIRLMCTSSLTASVHLTVEHPPRSILSNIDLLAMPIRSGDFL